MRGKDSGGLLVCFNYICHNKYQSKLSIATETQLETKSE